MTAGSAVVAEDSPPAFGNLHAYDDAIVPWIQRLTDGVHEHGAACMIQLTHLGRRSGWSHDDWLPVVVMFVVMRVVIVVFVVLMIRIIVL